VQKKSPVKVALIVAWFEVTPPLIAVMVYVPGALKTTVAPVNVALAEG